MKFRPLHDRVVIERIDAEAKTAGGIISGERAAIPWILAAEVTLTNGPAPLRPTSCFR